MMAPLLAPPAPAPPRISQLLPTVKCSNCNRPVPFADLVDHVCPPPPPTPSAPTLPKPPVSPNSATSLLPPRLQNLVTSPTSPSPRSPIQVPSPRQSSPPSPQRDLRSRDRLKINTGSVSSFQSRPSPLSRTEPSRASRDNSSSPVDRREPFPNSSPLRSRPTAAPSASVDLRTRTPSNNSTSSTSPHTARPSFSSSTTPVPSQNAVQPPPRQASYPPRPALNEIDTKSGGEAGMAGVGRRGFQAAARAAMFVQPAPVNGSGTGPPLRANAPKYLDINAAMRMNSGSQGTPPLSPNSGYSSHSPLSPISPAHPNSNSNGASAVSPTTRTPSPSNSVRHIPTATAPPPKTPLPEPPSTPISAVRLPFFEKYKNKLPTVNTSPTSTPTPTSINHNINRTSTNTINNNTNNDTATPRSRRDTSSSGPVRSTSTSTTSSFRHNPTPSIPKEDLYKSPLSPSSGSECGLAYADSTDYPFSEDDDNAIPPKGKAQPPPPPLPLTSSILRSNSNASSSHVRFPSTSDRSSSTRVSTGSAVKATTTPALSIERKHKPKKSGSISSVSSTEDEDGSTRSNSAAIAHALGLARTPPKSYGKFGGPGHRPGVIGGRERSGSATTSGSGSGSGSSYSRSTGTGLGSGGLERAMETLLEDVTSGSGSERGESSRVSGAGLSKSKSTGKQHMFGIGIPAAVGGGVSSGAGVGPQRSNTVPYSPESRVAKLPAIVRSRTSPSAAEKGRDRDAANRMDSGGEGGDRKERVRKKRVCVRCEKRIEDGRWVQVDGGGVLCENCWKNMYLPKCRRCHLPIEKQAVSSSDGQLKGKYHRDCFNCHTCHKPFPDKTFYVFDGKPLCAYHYHEANDSLCAAAHCGQPIEGPCAVSHTGDRYHPEHLLCEYPGHPECTERLEEYWEMDGRMLCERHANAARMGEEDEFEDGSRNGEGAGNGAGAGAGEWVQSPRAMKRVTRFIDLAGAGGLGGSGLM